MPSVLERFTIASPRSPGREVTVYLPEAHATARQPLPLLILHDGQNLFDPERAHVPGQHWRVAETADALTLPAACRPS